MKKLLKKARSLLLIPIILSAFASMVSCAVGGSTSDKDDSSDGDDDSDDDSECDISCYKDYLEGAIDCLHEYVDCLEAGNEMYICVQNIMACDESLQSDAKECTSRCENSCFGTFIQCMDECDEKKDDDDCEQTCSDQFCDCAKWLDCDCWYNTCAKNFNYCMDSAYQANDYEAMHQCADDYKSCWLGCIAK